MLERRFTTHAEVRESQGDELSMRISGYAARWGVLSEPLGGASSFREQLVPGCFQRSLQSDRDVKALFNHNPDAILGRKANGTLSVSEDAKGLRFRCSVAQTTLGKDVYRLIQRGDISDCSFAFETSPDGQTWGECDDPDNPGTRCALRTISSAKLYDVSVVGSPAYPQTSVGVASSMDMNSLTRSLSSYFPQGIPPSFPVEVRALLLRNDSSITDLAMQIEASKLF